MRKTESELLINERVSTRKSYRRCVCKLLFFAVCNGLSFTSGFLLKSYLIDIDKEEGSL